MTQDDQHTRGIAILGSTGSIGTQALEVIREQREHLHVEVLTAHQNAALLIQQSKEFQPNTVVIGDLAKLKEVKDALFDDGIKVYGGAEALEQVVEMEGIDMVLTALVWGRRIAANPSGNSRWKIHCIGQQRNPRRRWGFGDGRSKGCGGRYSPG